MVTQSTTAYVTNANHSKQHSHVQSLLSNSFCLALHIWAGIAHVGWHCTFRQELQHQKCSKQQYHAHLLASFNSFLKLSLLLLRQLRSLGLNFLQGSSSRPLGSGQCS